MMLADGFELDPWALKFKFFDFGSFVFAVLPFCICHKIVDYIFVVSINADPPVTNRFFIKRRPSYTLSLPMPHAGVCSHCLFWKVQRGLFSQLIFCVYLYSLFFAKNLQCFCFRNYLLCFVFC